jgi:nitrogenase molybdenum-iron protein beta chain
MSLKSVFAIWLGEQMANTLFSDMEYKGAREWSLNVW